MRGSQVVYSDENVSDAQAVKSTESELRQYVLGVVWPGTA